MPSPSLTDRPAKPLTPPARDQPDAAGRRWPADPRGRLPQTAIRLYRQGHAGRRLGPARHPGGRAGQLRRRRATGPVTEATGSWVVAAMPVYLRGKFGLVGTVILARSTSVAEQQHRRRCGSSSARSRVVALIGATLLAFALARWVSRPLAGLDQRGRAAGRRRPGKPGRGRFRAPGAAPPGGHVQHHGRAARGSGAREPGRDRGRVAPAAHPAGRAAAAARPARRGHRPGPRDHRARAGRRAGGAGPAVPPGGRPARGGARGERGAGAGRGGRGRGGQGAGRGLAPGGRRPRHRARGTVLAPAFGAGLDGRGPPGAGPRQPRSPTRSTR